MTEKTESQAIPAAMAGFLACHVLTCRFLMQEGIIDQGKFIAFLRTAAEGMRAGLEDERSLLPVNRFIDSLQATPSDGPLQ
jgi:hypothetical protein